MCWLQGNSSKAAATSASIDIRTLIKQSPEFILTARMSRRKLYALHTLQDGHNFNDHAVFDHMARLAKVSKKAEKAARGRERGIRDYYK